MKRGQTCGKTVAYTERFVLSLEGSRAVGCVGRNLNDEGSFQLVKQGRLRRVMLIVCFGNEQGSIKAICSQITECSWRFEMKPSVYFGPGTIQDGCKKNIDKKGISFIINVYTEAGCVTL